MARRTVTKAAIADQIAAKAMTLLANDSDPGALLHAASMFAVAASIDHLCVTVRAREDWKGEVERARAERENTA